MARRPRGKVVRSTAEQINRLVDYMSTHRLFACNEVSGPNSLQRMDAEWVRLKRMLAAYGPDKSVDQWKHTWRDLRKKAREEAVRARLALNTTGDTGSVPELNENNKKILFTIGDKRSNGFGGEQENGMVVGPIDPDATSTPPLVSTDNPVHDFEYVSVEAEVEIHEPSPEPPRRRRRVRRNSEAQFWAAAARAQTRTNKILQDIVTEVRNGVRYRKRERVRAGVHSLTF